MTHSCLILLIGSKIFSILISNLLIKCKNEFFFICSFGEWSSSKSQKPLLHNQWSQMWPTAVERKKLVSEEDKVAGDGGSSFCFFWILYV